MGQRHDIEHWCRTCTVCGAIVDYFTKWTEAFPMPDMETSTVARLFVNEFVKYGATLTKAEILSLIL